MTDSSLTAAALQRHYEDLVIGAIRAGDYSRPDTWFALNARMAFSMARIADAEARNLVHHDQAAHEVSNWRSVETLQSANVGADSEERL